jgi:hypothetical protein
MTPKQQERIVNKIKKIKDAIAADKKFWGGQYHDGQGLRYMPPQLYIQLNDFSGGLRYLKWFHKHFPNDSASPIFFFERTLIYFKTGRIAEAEKSVMTIFNGNVFLIDHFLQRELRLSENCDGLASLDYVHNYFKYTKDQAVFSDFSRWLETFISSEKFLSFQKEWSDLKHQIAGENDIDKRQILYKKIQALFT